MDEGSQETVQVNFGRPFPIFPLDRVTLLPHAVAPLYIFEPRYRQMVTEVLDAAGQIAMAVYRDCSWPGSTEGAPEIERAVCVGQIAQHAKGPDGTYKILLQGVCRARVVDELLPEGERLYRMAQLEPLEVQQVPDEALQPARERILDLLLSRDLSELASVHGVPDEVEERDIPTSALIELLAFSVLDEPRVQYNILAEGDVTQRARIVEGELARLGRIVRRARLQHDPEAPRGVTWN